MKRIAWLTDIHLNFLSDDRVEEFLARVSAERPDAVLVGGDIAESPSVCDYLSRLGEAVAATVYFVLGNHDFYFGSIGETRARMAHLCARQPKLHYLSHETVAPLTDHVGLVGHDGWADGRLGNYPRSLVLMQDHRLISELAGHDKRSRWEVLKRLGDEASAHFRRVLPVALAQYRDVLLLTHVPPWREACWHEGRLSDDDWAPHFTCQAAGEAILEAAAAHPHHRLTVLCGHTHGDGESQPLPNVQVFTGGADYGRPAIARVFEFD